MKKTAHLLSVSGGKDSTAMYLLAIEMLMRDRGHSTFEVVFADTGNEHPATLDYIRELPGKTGGPPIRWVAADFASDFVRKRRFIAEKWPAKGVPQDRIDSALAMLVPTGNPFLDLCMLKGRFPSSKAQFCTEELKINPIFEQVICPLWDAGKQVLSWQGIRADESVERATRRRFEKWGGYWIFRPLLRWTVEDVFSMHRRHGIDPNPLYRQGFDRVGCFPCINCKKAEIRETATRAPWAIEKIASWEDRVGRTSKRGRSSFFHAYDPPDHLDLDDPVATYEFFSVWATVEWSKTTRGGKQFDLMAKLPAAACASTYGLCE